ncbi:MAG: adenosylmethionine decarboxylase [Colwellia sp.]|jgi:S-adenosylmethionine decarboxylase|nr:MAG: adenosylmethionine decarboxylase [Colwellia sp.]
MNKISLYGFNNLTKNLSFSLYKLHYLTDEQAHHDYNAYISERFCANKLDTLLVTICHAIGGNVLNIAKQDYLPQGASVTLMISEEAQAEPFSKQSNTSLVAHLDKSHLCIHTYPEDTPQDGIAIFRADIELSTCGVISPLKVLNYVIEEFEADVIDIDYRIRGMTRGKQGDKLFVDDKLNNISDYFNAKLTRDFDVENHNFTAHNLFHSKLIKSNILLHNYLLGDKANELNPFEQSKIKTQIEQELKQLFTNST